MGKMIYLTLLLCLPGIALAGQDSLRVVYRHLNFHIPADPLLVGLLGSDSNIVIAKYSDDPGQKIIGFSVEQDLEFADCEPGIFFEEVLDVTAFFKIVVASTVLSGRLFLRLLFLLPLGVECHSSDRRPVACGA